VRTDSEKKHKSHNTHKSTRQTKKKTAGKGDIKDKVATMDVLAAANGQGSNNPVDQKPSKVTKKKSSKKPKRNLSIKERLNLYGK